MSVEFIIQKSIRPLKAIQFTGGNIIDIEYAFGINIPDKNCPYIEFEDYAVRLNEGDWIIKIPEDHFLYTVQDFWVVSEEQYKKWFTLINPNIVPNIMDILIET